MVRTFFIVVFLYSVIFSKETEHYIFGFQVDTFINSDLADAKLAFRLWLRDMLKDENIVVHTQYYNSQEEVVRDYVNDKLDIISISTKTYLDDIELYDSKSSLRWAFSQTSDRFYKYYLVVHKDSNIKSISDLQNKLLSILERDHMGKIWLDYLVYKDLQKPYNVMIKGEKRTQKLSEGVLRVFFKKSDFTIVPHHIYESMIELNPALAKKLVVLKESRPIFMSWVGVVRKMSNEFFQRRVLKIKNEVLNKQIRSLIKFHEVYKLDRKDIKELINFYDEYKHLKQKHNK